MIELITSQEISYNETWGITKYLQYLNTEPVNLVIIPSRSNSNSNSVNIKYYYYEYYQLVVVVDYELVVIENY